MAKFEVSVEDDRVIIHHEGLVIDVGPAIDGLTVEVYPFKSTPHRLAVVREDWTRGSMGQPLLAGQVQTFRLARHDDGCSYTTTGTCTCGANIPVEG